MSDTATRRHGDAATRRRGDRAIGRVPADGAASAIMIGRNHATIRSAIRRRPVAVSPIRRVAPALLKYTKKARAAKAARA